MTKMTYVDALTIAMNCVTDAAAKARLADLQASIVKKNSAERGMTAKQVDNKNYKAIILNGMVAGQRYTATEIQKQLLNGVDGMSNQRVSAMLTQLTKDGSVDRQVEKGRAYFSLPVSEK